MMKKNNHTHDGRQLFAFGFGRWRWCLLRDAPEELPPQSAVPPFKVGQRVFYVDGEGESHTAKIKKIDYVDKIHTCYTIEVEGGREVHNVHHVDLSVVHPTVEKVLGILNLHNETHNYLRVKYPTLKEFENFLSSRSNRARPSIREMANREQRSHSSKEVIVKSS
jgi:hypothetical protein